MRSKTPKRAAVSLDGAPATAQRVVSVVGTPEMFLASFWPWFLAGADGKEARDFLLSLLRPVDSVEVLEALGEPYKTILARVQLADPEAAARAVRADTVQAQRDLDYNEGMVDSLRDQAARPAPDAADAGAVEAELWAVEAEIEAVQAGRPQLKDTAPLAQMVASIKARREALADRMEPLPRYRAGDVCPACGQAIAHEHVQKVTEAALAKNSDLQAEIDRLAQMEASARAALAEVERRNAEAEAAFRAEAGEKAAGLARRRSELQRGLADAAAQNRAREEALKLKAEAEEKIRRMEDQNERIKARIGENKTRLDAIAAYVAKKTEMLVDQLRPHLRRAGVELFEIVKTTGEVKPAFKLTWDGRPARMLSASQQIALGLELAGLVKGLTGVRYPTFLDDAESIRNRPEDSRLYRRERLHKAPKYVMPKPKKSTSKKGRSSKDSKKQNEEIDAA